MELLFGVELVVLVPVTGSGTEAGPGFSLGMLLWLRSSSQDPMAAARWASLPLRPMGGPEDVEDVSGGGWTSACLFSMDRGVLSSTGSQVPENEQSRVVWVESSRAL